MAKVLTVGHGARSLEDLVALLRDHLVGTLIDLGGHGGGPVERPAFTRRQLAERLVLEGTGYFHEPALGGRRWAVPGSPNTALAPGDRGYADHMTTPVFRATFERVAGLARRERVVLMCCAPHPNDCQRRYLSDALALAGFDVEHVLDGRGVVRHVRHPAARRLPDGSLVYRVAEQLSLFG